MQVSIHGFRDRCDYAVRSCAVAALAMFFASVNAPAQIGVPGCTGTPCLNTVPCKQCTGRWTDDFGGTWNVTSSASDSASGTLFVNVQSFGCISQTYQVAGNLIPVAGTIANGYASISLHATNPVPGYGGTGCRYNIATYADLTAAIQNNGCDLVTYSSSTLVTDRGTVNTNLSRPADLPTGETTAFVGWSTGAYATIGQWRSALTGGINPPPTFDGRQVTEAAAGESSDTCHFEGSRFQPAGLSGGVWNVGFYFYNTWDDDYVGNLPAAVTYYRQNLRPPCSATVPQGMYIFTHGQYGYEQSYESLYTTGSVGEGIPDYTHIGSSRDGHTASKVWP